MVFFKDEKILELSLFILCLLLCSSIVKDIWFYMLSPGSTDMYFFLDWVGTNSTFVFMTASRSGKYTKPKIFLHTDMLMFLLPIGLVLFDAFHDSYYLLTFN